MSSGRKSIGPYYAKADPKTILTCAIFWSAALFKPQAADRDEFVMRNRAGGGPRLPAAELAPRGCATGSAAARTLVLVTEDEPALLEVVG